MGAPAAKMNNTRVKMNINRRTLLPSLLLTRKALRESVFMRDSLFKEFFIPEDTNIRQDAKQDASEANIYKLSQKSG